MQPRFERRTGKSAYKLLENPRFRAGYDFLLLRCESGELEAELGQWWTGFVEGDNTERERLVATAGQAGNGPKRKRAPRRRNRSSDSATAEAAAPAPGGE
jgi:poly(A) polymerase